MKDNAITTTDGIEVYKHNINYYADEYIHNELEIDHVDTDNKQIVKDNFVDMLFYICDHIEKGWFYFKNGKWHWTKGMPSRPFMYNTASALRNTETITRIARRVFGED